jgi:hypothetical protein
MTVGLVEAIRWYISKKETSKVVFSCAADKVSSYATASMNKFLLDGRGGPYGKKVTVRSELHKRNINIEFDARRASDDSMSKQREMAVPVRLCKTRSTCIYKMAIR